MPTGAIRTATTTNKSLQQIQPSIPFALFGLNINELGLIGISIKLKKI